MKNGIALVRWASLMGAAALLPTPYSAFAQAVADASNGDSLERGFQDPPNSARPRVWWHWMNGNISRDGIAQDLQWMKRVGIGGAQTFDAYLSTPKIVDTPLPYMSAGWKDAFAYAAHVADKLGLELAVASSPGFSETGGPWVASADGMKKLVWSETMLPGGKRFVGQLIAPPNVVGPFQALPVGPQVSRSAVPPKPFYADVAVIAYPAPKPVVSAPFVATTQTGDAIDASVLADGDYKNAVRVPVGTRAQPGGVILRFDTPQTIRSATLYIPGKNSLFDVPLAPRLESSMDGISWQPTADMPITPVPTTVAFAPVTARQFRLVLAPAQARPLDLGTPSPGAAGTEILSGGGAPLKTIKIAEFRVSGDDRIDRFETKAAFALADDYHTLDTPNDRPGIAPGQVVDLTSRMRPDGTLDWTPPHGQWRVIRFGYALTGIVNHPAAIEATGLEVDKLDSAAVRRYLGTYLGMIRDAAGPGMMGTHGVRAIVNDSIEADGANWTPRMIEQFRRLCGYDPIPWLPALTGAVIGSAKQSDAFLYDFRKVLGDLISSEHYGTVASVAHANGLRVYGESLEGNRVALGDDMTMRSHADVPMAAMWTYARVKGAKPIYVGDIRGAASVAHLYGQNVVAAESLTSSFQPWANAPGDLRRIIDLELVHGVNLPVIHTSVHQPLIGKIPGISFFIFGQYFTRNETWAEMAKPWVDYIARNDFLLQQGRNVADVAYFYGEDTPVGVQFANVATELPKHYAYDFISPDAVLNLLSVDQGQLVSPGGARYAVLYLGSKSRHMSLAMLRRLSVLAEQGATIVGAAPVDGPGLADDKISFDALVGRMWGAGPTTPIGKGVVIAEHNVETALAQAGVATDFTYKSTKPDSEILFSHRQLHDGDLYFITNRKDRPEHLEARFRVSGKIPEIWHADTGTHNAVSYRIEGGGTVVPITMTGDDSVFVVFRKPAQQPAITLPAVKTVPVMTLSGPWTVTFQAGHGAPPSARLSALQSLSDSNDPGIKYFSGIATYTNQFTLHRHAPAQQPLWLDLGTVSDLAEVRINGQLIGTVWHAPYRIDIARAVRAGRNDLDIRVANLWVNRLIGDAQPGASKTTFTSQATYKPTAPLRSSGLSGPVRLEAEEAAR